MRWGYFFLMWSSKIHTSLFTTIAIVRSVAEGRLWLLAVVCSLRRVAALDVMIFDWSQVHGSWRSRRSFCFRRICLNDHAWCTHVFIHRSVLRTFRLWRTTLIRKDINVRVLWRTACTPSILGFTSSLDSWKNILIRNSHWICCYLNTRPRMGGSAGFCHVHYASDSWEPWEKWQTHLIQIRRPKADYLKLAIRDVQKSRLLQSFD